TNVWRANSVPACTALSYPMNVHLAVCSLLTCVFTRSIDSACGRNLLPKGTYVFRFFHHDMDSRLPWIPRASLLRIYILFTGRC
ncbi:hypothetical protein B0H10DRAFT_2111738, partial [Mycena sp. CBHHK59/15]